MKKKYWVLLIAAILPLLFLVAAPSLLRDDLLVVAVPQILDMPYAQSRQIVLDAGWSPVLNAAPDDLVLFARDVYGRGFAEVDACAPVGDTRCKFYFQNEDQIYLEIITTSEDLVVVSVKILDERAFESAHP